MSIVKTLGSTAVILSAPEGSHVPRDPSGALRMTDERKRIQEKQQKVNARTSKSQQFRLFLLGRLIEQRHFPINSIVAGCRMDLTATHTIDCDCEVWTRGVLSDYVNRHIEQ